MGSLFTLMHADGHASYFGDTYGLPERVENTAMVAGNLVLGPAGEIRKLPSWYASVLPADLGLVSAISGNNAFVARKTDGTVVSWAGSTGKPLPVPEQVHGEVAIAVGDSYAIAITEDGSPILWQMFPDPYMGPFGTEAMPPGTTNVVAVALGRQGLALREAAGDALPMPPSITQQPVALSRLAGESAEFSVVATNGNRSYQWFKDSEAIKGATDASFVIDTVLPEDVGYYHVVVTTFAGSTKSLEVALTVLPELATIAVPPASSTVVETGGALNLSVTPKGTAPFSYQWRHKGRLISDASGPNLQRTGLTYDKRGAYSVTVTDATGAASTALAFVNVALKRPHLFGTDSYPVQQSFSIRSQPDVVAARFGEAMFVLKRDGRIARLYPDGSAEVVPGIANVVDFTVGSKQVITLHKDGTVRMHQFADYEGPINLLGRPPAGLTQVVAVAAAGYVSLALRADGSVVGWGHDYGAGTATPPAGLPPFVSITNGAPYGVTEDGRVYTWTTTPNIIASLDKVADLFANGYPLMAVRFDGSLPGWPNLPTSPRVIDFAGSVHGYLILREGGELEIVGGALPGLLAARWTRCVDLDGWASFVALRESDGDTRPVIAKQPTDKSVPTGAKLTLSATITNAPNATYQWLRNGETIVGATAATLIVPAAQAADAGDYVLLVRTPEGEQRSETAKVVVIPPPVIELNVDSYQTLAPGASILVTASVSGEGPFKYQWRKSTSVISGATLARYAVKAGKAGSAAFYSVTVADKHGMKATAQLFVVTPSTEAREIAAWGTNHNGQLNIPDGLQNIRMLRAGRGMSAALAWNGDLTTWGDFISQYGAPPDGFHDVASLSFGEFFLAVLRADGKVSAQGQMTGDFFDAIEKLHGVVAISAGQEHVIALRADGTVFGAGDNYYGQLNVPAGLKGVVAIASGPGHVLALKSDGTVATWGGYDPASLRVPRGLSGVKAIAAGGDYSLALRTDGTVVAWGSNSHGNTTIPAGLKNVVAIASAGEQSYALRANGTVVSWGLESLVRSIPAELNSRIKALFVAESHGLLLREPAAATTPLASTRFTSTSRAIAIEQTETEIAPHPAVTNRWSFTRIGDKLVGLNTAGESVIEWSIDLALAEGASFAAWRTWHFNQVELADETISGPEAVLGPDWSPNLAKFIAGVGPREAVSGDWMQLDPATGSIREIDGAFIDTRVIAEGRSWSVSFELRR